MVWLSTYVAMRGLGIFAVTVGYKCSGDTLTIAN
ncbi:hypothetical protein QFZ98_005053 [Paraburkholderia youngii]